MSSNSKVVALLLLLLLGCFASAVRAGEVCPSRNEQALRFVDVFDGKPEEMATLMPDLANEKSGYWQLDYVYDAGRFVTIRCKYADGKFLDVKLSTRIGRCYYKINQRSDLSVICR